MNSSGVERKGLIETGTAAEVGQMVTAVADSVLFGQRAMILRNLYLCQSEEIETGS